MEGGKGKEVMEERGRKERLAGEGGGGRKRRRRVLPAKDRAVRAPLLRPSNRNASEICRPSSPLIGSFARKKEKKSINII